MIRKGTQVKWTWGNGTAYGKVQNTYDYEISKTIDGTEVKRKGEVGNKALYILTDKGDYVLKLESEVERK